MEALGLTYKDQRGNADLALLTLGRRYRIPARPGNPTTKTERDGQVASFFLTPQSANLALLEPDSTSAEREKSHKLYADGNLITGPTNVQGGVKLQLGAVCFRIQPPAPAERPSPPPIPSPTASCAEVPPPGEEKRQQRHDDHEESTRQAQQNLRTVQKQLMAALQQIDSLKEERLRAQQERSMAAEERIASEAQQRLVDQARQSAEARLSEAHRQLQAEQDKNKAQIERHSQLDLRQQQTIDLLRAELRKFQAERTQAADDKKSLLQKLASETLRCDQLQQEVDNLKGRIKTLLNENQRIVEAANSEAREGEQQRQVCDEQIQQRNARIRELEVQWERMSQAIGPQRKKSLGLLQVWCKLWPKEIERVRKQLTVAQVELETFKKQANSSTPEAKGLQRLEHALKEATVPTEAMANNIAQLLNGYYDILSVCDSADEKGQR